jgi:rhodanese-related sulfurtransferase
VASVTFPAANIGGGIGRGRSGGRSLAAAKAMAEAGYRACLKVAGGFEGPLDDGRHRGAVGGWKAAGLPWRQG